MQRLLVVLAILFARPVIADPLVVGTRVFPPFVIHQPDGTYTGISIELWKRVAAAANLTYTIQEAPIPALLDPEAHGIDVVVSLPITQRNQTKMDLTHAFYSTGLAIATRAEPTSGLASIASKILSRTFLAWLAILIAGLCAVGLVVWSFARSPEFTFTHGVLWAFESLAGKADALTRRRGGRVLSLLWTFVCILLLSIVTAELTSQLTLSQLSTKVGSVADLPKVRVGVTKESVGARYADVRQLKARAYDDVASAITGLEAGEVDAVVSEAPLLQYEVAKRASQKLVVLPGTFQNHGYGFGINRAHRDQLPAINGAMLNTVESDDWPKVLAGFLGTHD